MYLGLNSLTLSPQRMKHALSVTAVLILLFSQVACSISAGTFSIAAAGSHRRTAEKLKMEGKLDEAIAEYEKHIAERGSASSKFPGENPSFYYIMIGDLHLRQDRPELALDAYLKAHDDGVMQEFIVDRIRQVSGYYEQREQLQAAIELLSKYRDLDPLLFDWDIDRLHKKSVSQEVKEDSFSIDDISLPEPR